MKSVCIVTWYKVCNHGAFLQAYALKKVLEKYKCRVSYYDYRRKVFKHDYYRLIKNIQGKSIRKRNRHDERNNTFYKEKNDIFGSFCEFIVV